MVKLFRKVDQVFTPTNGGAVLGLVNSSYSQGLGGGIGTFEDVRSEWTVTYDEILFILDGTLTLGVGDEDYVAGPGDTLWIPKDTALVYKADAKVTFFFAVCPSTESPSASKHIDFPTAGPSD